MKTTVKVERSRHGWWDVRGPHENVIARYVSEYRAWEAGRHAALDAHADLVIRDDGLPLRLETFDHASRTLRVTELEPPHKTQDKRHLILLVEDMLDARELYAEYLSYAGFSVVTAINGHEALRLARMLRPDLILMDIRMPGMDGLEATADLKADPACAHIPIVAITADPSSDLDARARAAGCVAFITKPALPNEVAEAITKILGASPREQARGAGS